VSRVDPATTRIGWIGLGVMGSSMASHLIRGGYSLTVHTRTPERAAAVLSRGARWAKSPRAVAELSDVVFTMLGFPTDVDQVIRGAQSIDGDSAVGNQGVLAGASAGTILVDMTTSRPSLASAIAQAASEAGCIALDAPVSGGDVGARNGSLSIMVGGDEGAYQSLMPLWSLMGKTIIHHGGPGSGQRAKLVNQTLIASNMIGVCEALLLAERSGLDLERVLGSVSVGAAGSWSLQNLAPRMARQDWSAGFFVEHFVKDLAITLEECQQLGIDLPGVTLAKTLYERLQSMGHGRSGTQALLLAVRAMQVGQDDAMLAGMKPMP
jgi:3-hydroxyisobutyrate dehydrogenase